ncbi:MAG: PKD domain-containing protein [Vicingaceae bacterium]|nr:PKD domain-containing protein [Vicingaceae bacterium]
MRSIFVAFLLVATSVTSLAQTQDPLDCESPILGATCHPSQVGNNGPGGNPEDGSGVLGSFYSYTACGLNYVQASNLTTTRYTGSTGTGIPTTLTIAGIPVCASVEKAFLWWSGGGTVNNPNYTFMGNPLVGARVGNHGQKCWGTGGTETYRADVTAFVTGNGAYNFSHPIGNDIDGATLMVIYTDPTATYEGTISLADGAISAATTPTNQTLTLPGAVCANTVNGSAFVINSDMQNNVAANHTCTMNGVGPTNFPNDFYNFNIQPTNFTTGQTTVAFEVAPTGGDCYLWSMMGIYYQTTTCVVCVPPPGLTSTMAQVDASCNQCDGTATVTPNGGTAPYTYSWNTTPVQNTQTATNLCPGTYIVTVNDNSGCLTVMDTVVITQAATPNPPVITPAGPYCLNSPAVNLTTSSPGGTWSGTGITNAANGTFDPNTAGVGTHQIIYVDSGACAGADTINIIVNLTADATINPAGPYCTTDLAVVLTAANPGGVWSGTGITNTATGAFDPNTAGAGTHTITYAIAGACGDTQTVNIIVGLTMDATITPAGPFCENDPSALLAAVDPGGIWSGTGITNTANGTFDPMTAGPGTHTITYAIGGNCGDTQTVNITVIYSEDATITPAGPLCINDPAFNLTAVDPNGVWAGNGITNAALGTFDPMAAGVGTHTITYTIAGACGDVGTINIVVTALDDPTINQIGPFCVSEPQTLLTSVTPGGTWSGPGVTNPAAGSFSPGAAGPGTHQVIYVTGGSCSNTDTIDIVVNALPDVQFTVDTLAVCMIPSQPFEFTNTTDTTGGMVGTSIWDFGDGSTGSGNIVSHTYNAPGTYNVTLTVTSTPGAGGCTNTLVKNSYVQVYANPTADFLIAPNPATVFNPTVNFIDQSYVNIVTWDWNLGGLFFSNNQNPTYTFPEDTGTYLITLTVTDNHGCQNTMYDNLIVKGEHGMFVPNAFTPDFDGVNDGFYPKGFGITDFGYGFYIFDRWGELIFESHTKFEPWFGTYKNKLVQNGVYVWRLEYQDVNGKQHEAVGKVTIVK